MHRAPVAGPCRFPSSIEPRRSGATAKPPRRAVWAFAVPLVAFAGGAANAGGISVMPVTIQMVPGLMTAALTVTNEGDSETSFQVRAFAWSQGPGGNDQLATSDELLASPPLGTIAAGGRQVVRLVLRRPAQGKESAYRILLDQIPPPASPGTVRVALRLSIPIFAEPASRIAPHLQWRVEASTGENRLVAVNKGGRHERVRDIVIAASGGGAPKVEANVSPYILAGATRSWKILASGLVPGASLLLTARADAGAIDQPVRVGASS